MYLRLTLLAAATLSILACSPSGTPATTGQDSAGAPAKAGEITGMVSTDGSSTVFPVTEAMAEEFQKENAGIKVTVGMSGTGGGFKKFCRGETDISNASRPIKGEEKEACKAAGVEYIELPVAMDALTVVVNPQNTWANDLTVDELKAMWVPEAQGKITNWNQIRPSFPDKPLVLYGAGTDSGTYDYFTAAIVGKEHSSRGDYTASEDDNVLVQGVSGDANALGFFGLAYYEENADKLKAVGIKTNAAAQAVAPSVETARSGQYQPLSRPIFIYVSKKAAETKPEVARFVEFYLDSKHSEGLVQEVGYVPLPENALAAMRERFAKREIGTGFTGSKIGVSIDELLKEKLVY
ncbi:PstS family phosphate ABC transporter substrate-binding protein [Xanthomonas euvesicatoria]|jgi:phosphate transport system substrate-binding protein|uniref:PstS family phosphate ABC transporter substrate-binding protein n=1 Tax=Lysobacteraceae TaxID=32033 RepID=UPI0002D70B09|nr:MULTISPECIES: PstS family phosphate ABC transporter substrate-binding protein [Xanthomonadaceae]APO88818.1 protein sphX [Xanthomonas euvesicatoria]MBN4953040.1 PstS family phosphate ABC transporter substrate-binding protein [Stenotrophomonas maltophilia]MCC8517523.1 PstS family phosphate ABC transporter substrate-binding protein [Xanthomonas euvesicatoria pv. euvesicatoria]MCC8546842.1 PstS family phosphate ABC transporter substrate-binding protein [Xanthomonas euvesicatoria pv. euvesicatori